MASIDTLVSALNPEQAHAVRTTEGPVLVLAGAGSGKTRVITTRIAYLIAQGRALPEEILAVTFTNKAAGEMRERVASIVGPAAAKRITISTFHSFCVRVLRAEIELLGYRRNFTISSEGDARTLLRRTLRDIDGVQDGFDVDIFLQRIGAAKNAGLDAPADVNKRAVKGAQKTGRAESEAVQRYAKWLPEVYERYQSALKAANALDFDDLLAMTLRLWREHPAALERYQQLFRYVMVDEYQDTNGVQYALLRSLVSAHGNLCVVGDDDQSIYGWRGADISNILHFERDFPGAEVVKLEQNYRSTETVLGAANAVIGNNRSRRPKALWSALGKGRPLDWFVVADEEAEAKEAVAWLTHIQGRSDARHSDFAILYRSNLQSRPFEIALRQAGIPYTVVGGHDFYERAEIKDIVSYLKAIANPRDEAAVLRVVNVPRRGVGDVTLHRVHDLCLRESMGVTRGLAALVEREDLPSNVAHGIRDFLGVIRDFRAKFRQSSGKLTEVVTELVDRIGYREDLFRSCKSPEQFEARWGNVQALMSSVLEYEESTTEPTLSGFLDQSALVSDGDQRGDGKDRRTSGVQLMTIHSAKGLEFPFVFLVGCEEGLLPHERNAAGDLLEEERRLFYVAVTRAQRHLTFFEALRRMRFRKPRATKTSRFMTEIPERLVKRHIRATPESMPDPEPAPAKPRAKAKTSRPRGGQAR